MDGRLAAVCVCGVCMCVCGACVYAGLRSSPWQPAQPHLQLRFPLGFGQYASCTNHVLLHDGAGADAGWDTIPGPGPHGI